MSMKRILSIFVVALVAFSASAKVVHIAPEAPRAQDNIRYALRDSLTADTIMLAAGTYVEASSIVGNRNIVIMAEEGVEPVVQLATGAYIKVQSGANIVVEGLKFDGATNGTNYGIRPTDASASTLQVKGCEFYGFTKNIITADGTNHINSVIIEDCYFHDNTRAAVYFAGSSATDGSDICDRLEVRNTTIANISALSGAGAIDIRNNTASESAETATLIVDHCTFYNIQGYERVVQSYKSPLVTISNCIFAQPEAATNYATWAYGGTVSNCLAYNIAAGRDWDACPTFTGMINNADPLFVNAAEGNFTLGEGSPALTAATDGGALGDPRWVPAAEEMMTLYLKLSSDWAGWPAKYAIYYFDEGSNGWSNFMTLAEGEDDIYVGSIPAAYADDQIIFVRLDGAATEVNWANKWSQTVNLTIPEGKDFFTVISGGTGSECNGTWSKYGEVLPEAKFYIAGSMTGWAPNVVSYEDSYTLHLAAGAYKFKVVNLASEWKGFSDLTEAGRAAELYMDPDGNVCFVLAEEGDVVVTFTNELYKVEGAFVPALVQLIGINGWQVAEGHAIDLTPAEDHLTTSATVELADGYYEFKVILAGDWVGKAHGEAEGKYTIKNDWTWVDALSYEGDNIILSMGDGDIVPGAYTFTWTYATGKLEVTFPTATGITNTEVSEKVVKMIENGQLIIIKNGVRYNTQGAVVK